MPNRRNSQQYHQNMDRFDESRNAHSRNLSSSVSQIYHEELKEANDSSQIVQDNNSELNEGPEKVYTCLVANDELVQLLMVEAILDKQGFKVVTANNGQEAYEKVMKNNT